MKTILYTNIRVGHALDYAFDICYEYVVRNDRLNIINYIIATSPRNSNELLHVGLHAIGQNKVFIIKLLIDANYDLNTAMLSAIIGQFYKIPCT